MEHSRYESCAEEKKSLGPASNQTQAVQPVAHHYTDRALQMLRVDGILASYLVRCDSQ
jgi:hypothetical protein